MKIRYNNFVIFALSHSSYRKKNIILVSPHGWGKSSLVYKVGSIITDRYYNFRIYYIDLQSVHSEDCTF